MSDAVMANAPPTDAQDHEEDAHTNAFRRPHKKSRFGCRACKQRRIKCDEARPQCSNCVRRKVRCDFLPPEPDASDSSRPAKLALPPAVTSSSTDESDLYIVTDLELMHNWSTATSSVLCAGEDADHFFAHDVPHSAFRNPPIMHLLLSLSALHLRRSAPASKRAGYLMFQSQGHASKAQALLTSSPHGGISSPDRQTAALLLLMHTLMQGPKEGAYLGFYDEGVPNGFLNLTAARDLVASLDEPLHSDTAIRPSAVTNPHPCEALPDKQPRGGLTEEIFDFKLHFFRLMKFIESLAAEDPGLGMYVDALTQLHTAFKAFYSADAPHMSLRAKLNHVLHWLLVVSSPFLAALRNRRPMALVIFAHFAMLLHHFDEPWLISSWPTHILAGIHTHLHPNYREWTNWPREKTNFVTPRDEDTQWPLFPHRPSEEHFEQYRRSERSGSPRLEL